MEFEQKLRKTLCEVVFNKSFKDVTTFKIGGKIRYLLYPNTLKELIKVVKLCKEYNKSHIVLGGGSNVLAGDDFFDGVVIKTTKLNKMEFKGKKFIAECGTKLFSCVMESKKMRLSGLEWAVGIPGTVGGACIMNAGAFGHEMSEFVKRVKIIKNNKIFWTNDFNFAYRNSSFQKDNSIILEVALKLEKGKHENIKNLQQEYFLKRKNSQPINYSSAGSVFKRENDIIPAKIIDELGLKGKNSGGAEVSEKHAGFIINKNNATSEDYFTLANEIKKIVKEKTNIDLHFEVKFVK